MISVIVCSRTPRKESETLHMKMIKATIGVAHEYICIDNSKSTYSLCSAYNAGVNASTGDLCLFLHDDVFCMEQGFGKILEKKFLDNHNLGCVGLAGTNYLPAHTASWVTAGRPFIAGAILHELDSKQILTVYSDVQTDVPAVVVDGLFFAIPKKLFETIRFDEITFNGFHGYDLDICMQIRKTHAIIVTRDILVKHKSGGTYSSAFETYQVRFLAKYAQELPASCTTETPNPATRIGFKSFDITDRLPKNMPW